MGSALRRGAFLACATLLLVSTIAPTRAAEVDATGAWMRPVDGPLVRPFQEPTSVYGAGHRGADLAAPPGTSVRAANDGEITFAGSVAGTLHVTVTHAGGLRTSYSFLQSVSVRTGAHVTRGDVLGTTGGANDDHDGNVLHLGLRLGEQYLDPMVLFRPVDLARAVHLAPVDPPNEQPWTAADERRELSLSLRLPTPGHAAAAPADDHGCGDSIPIVGGVVSAGCDVGAWVGDRAGRALDVGLDTVHAFTGIATSTLDTIARAARGHPRRVAQVARRDRSRNGAHAHRHDGTRPGRDGPTLRAHGHRGVQHRRARRERRGWVDAPCDGRRWDHQLRRSRRPRSHRRPRRDQVGLPTRRRRSAVVLLRPRRGRLSRRRHLWSDRRRRRAAPRSTRGHAARPTRSRGRPHRALAGRRGGRRVPHPVLQGIRPDPAPARHGGHDLVAARGRSARDRQATRSVPHRWARTRSRPLATRRRRYLRPTVLP